MKMADGGFRPAYNCQVASVAERQVVVAVEVETMGSDRGLMRPMLERHQGALIAAARSATWSMAASTRTTTSSGPRGATAIKVYCPAAQQQAQHRSLRAARQTMDPVSPPGAGA